VSATGRRGLWVIGWLGSRSCGGWGGGLWPAGLVRGPHGRRFGGCAADAMNAGSRADRGRSACLALLTNVGVGSAPDSVALRRARSLSACRLRYVAAIGRSLHDRTQPHMPNSGRCLTAYSYTAWHIPSMA
jgi:hypothetical protein